jgi:hypothetical protein
VEAAGPEPDRVLAQLALGDVQQRVAVIVDVAVIREELVVAAGDDLGHDHLDAELDGPPQCAAHLLVGVHDECLHPGEVAHELVGVDRLQRTRIDDPLERHRDILVAGDRGAVRSLDAELRAQPVGLVLVEHREQHLVVRLVWDEPEVEQHLAVAGDQVEGLVLAGEDHRSDRRAAQPLEPALLHPRLAAEPHERRAAP